MWLRHLRVTDRSMGRLVKSFAQPRDEGNTFTPIAFDGTTACQVGAIQQNFAHVLAIYVPIMTTLMRFRAIMCCTVCPQQHRRMPSEYARFDAYHKHN